MASPPPETLDRSTTSTPPPAPASPSPPQSDPNPSAQPPPEPGSQPAQGDGEEEEEEEEAECGFCLFMKAGGCKDAFISWEQCVEAAEKSGDNIVDKCFQVTTQLKKCMDAHADYYEPILRAEEAMADSIAAEMKSEEIDKDLTKDDDKDKDDKGKVDSSE